MDLYAQIAQKIVEAQEQVIGPVAVEQARAVVGLTVEWDKDHSVAVADQKNASQLIDQLVGQYEELFGPIAVETCKEATRRYAAQLPPDQIPKSLQ
jgi:hypothetical protein